MPDEQSTVIPDGAMSASTAEHMVTADCGETWPREMPAWSFIGAFRHMVNWSRVYLIFRRESVDQLRDRRTIFVLIGLPFALYLVLGVGLVHLAGSFIVQPTTVVVAGTPNPDVLPFLDGDTTTSPWMSGGESSGLNIITPVSPGREGATSALRESVLEIEQILASSRDSWKTQISLFSDPKNGINSGHPTELTELVTKTLAEHKLHAIVIIPDGFPVRQPDSVSNETVTGSDTESLPAPVVVYSSANSRSVHAGQRMVTGLVRWQRAITEDFMTDLLAGKSFPPMDPEAIDVATRVERSSNIWAIIFPALIVLMTVLGAFYPAIDLCAGERERGTLETLLVCPARRVEILLGKFLLVMTFSCISAMLNLISLGLISQSALTSVTRGNGVIGQALEFPSFGTLVWVIVLMVLISAPFCALSLALASFARSTKEAQFYVAPLMGVALTLTTSCLLPGVELTAFHALLPVVGPVLWLKALLSDGISGLLIGNLALVLVASAGWSVLAIMLAVEQFKDERMLFPDSESFHPIRSLRKLLREPPPLPTPAAAGLCFIAIMLVQLWGAPLLANQIQGQHGPGIWQLLISGQQVLSLAVPPLLMAWLFTSQFRKTLKLHRVRPGFVFWSMMLAVGIHPLMSELAWAIRSWFSPLPTGVPVVLQLFDQEHYSLAAYLAAFALIPGLCEELAFRGFILSGFQSRQQPLLAVVFSSLLFGAMHVVPQYAFNAALLGVPLAMLTLNCRSIFPAMAFHVFYNALDVLRAYAINNAAPGFIEILWTSGAESPHYAWWTIVAAFIIVGLACRNLSVVSSE